jgi:hypothetical protein
VGHSLSEMGVWCNVCKTTGIDRCYRHNPLICEKCGREYGPPIWRIAASYHFCQKCRNQP